MAIEKRTYFLEKRVFARFSQHDRKTQWSVHNNSHCCQRQTLCSVFSFHTGNVKREATEDMLVM